MIIGNGMLAKAFEVFSSNEEIVIFASGVSNSKETQVSNFLREENLLKEIIHSHKNKLLVYFSTCSIEDESQSDSLYILHKLKMEALIQSKVGSYYIFRLPQVVGNTTSPTLMNFLITAVNTNKHFLLQKNATRNLIDVCDVIYFCSKIINENLLINEVINIASPFNFKVLSIVSIVESLLNKKANYKLINDGKCQEIDISKISFFPLKEVFKKNYVEETIKKRITSMGFLYK